MTDTKNTVSDELNNLTLEQKVRLLTKFGGTSERSKGYNEAIERVCALLRASIPGGVGVKDALMGLERYHQMTDGWGDEVIGLKQHPTGDYVKWSDILAICRSLSALDLSPAEGEPVTLPVRMRMDGAAVKAINFMLGSSDEEDDTPTDAILWVGNLEGDEGEPVHGLHLANAEYPEEGSITLVEFAAPSNPVVSDEMIFTTTQDAYLRGLDWGRKYSSTEAEELKASYDYADKTTAAMIKAAKEGK